MVPDHVIEHFRSEGYVGRSGGLYSPTGCLVRGVIKQAGGYYLPESIADALEALEQTRQERTGRRGLDLRGKVFHTTMKDAIGR